MKTALLAASLILGAMVPVETFASGDAPSPVVAERSSSGIDDLTASQALLVKSYVDGSKDTLLSLSELARALGLGDTVKEDRSALVALDPEASEKTLSGADKVASQSAAVITEALKKDSKMDAQSRKHFALGMTALGNAVISYSGLKPAVSDFRKKLVAQPETAKLDSGQYIVKALPGRFESMVSMLDDAVSYAKRNDIKLPPKASKALSLVK